MENSYSLSELLKQSRAGNFKEYNCIKKFDPLKASASRTNFHDRYGPGKCSLSKLINSVYNYKKESGDNVDLDLTSFRPTRLFKEEGEYIHVNTHLNNNTSKTQNIASTEYNFDKNNNLVFKKKIITRITKKSLKKTPKPLRSSKLSLYLPQLIDSVDNFINLEKVIVNLLTKIKSPEFFNEDCKFWFEKFEKTPLNMGTIYQNSKNKIKDEMFYNKTKHCINLLFASILVGCQITSNNFLNELDDEIEYYEIALRDLSELMINHHKLYLLLCLLFLTEYKLINCQNQLVIQLNEQIKRYLKVKNKKLDHKEIIENEIINQCQLLYEILTKILTKKKNSDISLLNLILNIQNIELSKLYEYLNNNYFDKNENHLLLSENFLDLHRYKNKISKSFVDKTEKIDIDNIPNIQNSPKRNSSKIINIIINNNNNSNNNNSYSDIYNNISHSEVDEKELLYINKRPNPPFLKYNSFNSGKKFILVLDLDETLVQCRVDKININEGTVFLRPGLFQFLDNVFPLFELVIWTVATQDYADPIIDIIENDKRYFSQRLYREYATIKNKYYVKDLNNLGKPLDKVIIVDDREVSFYLQKENGILIKPFLGTAWECKNDFVLYDLYKILAKIIIDKSQDVRKGICKYKHEIKEKITKNHRAFNIRK